MSTVPEIPDKYNLKDEKTPPAIKLCGLYKRSFAFETLNVRVPVILTKLIDYLCQDKDEIAAQLSTDDSEILDIKAEIKEAIGSISQMKFKLQTNKPMDLLDASSKHQDIKLWNDFLQALPETQNTYYTTCWLYAECYIYRKLQSAFEDLTYLQNFDYFRKQKLQALQMNLKDLEQLATTATTHVGELATNEKRQMLIKLLKADLWGNRNDLSISCSKALDVSNENILDRLDTFDQYLLDDHTERIWNVLAKPYTGERTVDFVLDNVGMELSTDFLLADFLLEQKLCTKVRFHGKVIPWFISDVLETDYCETLAEFSKAGGTLKELAAKWQTENKMILMGKEYFWTSPYEFHEMQRINCSLYQTLAEAHLVIFKGDLNYRKLLGDFNWDFTTEFGKCLRGFLPTNICALRTIKADLISGLKPGVAEHLDETVPRWMLTGQYGVIQMQEY